MGEIKKEDITFLDEFFSAEELKEEALIELEKRLKSPQFKAYYQSRLKAHYTISPIRKFIAYLPMIIMIILTLIGGYLILTKLL